MATFTRHATVKEIVTRVLKSIALSVPASVAGSTQATPAQMFALLTEMGQELMTEYEWQIKTKTQTINVQAPVTNYDVPSDLVSYINDTGWNFTSRLPMVGPLTEQQWQELQARDLGGTTFALMFQMAEDQLQFYYAPSDAQECKISYTSRGWVRDGQDPTVYKDTAERDDDVVLFDPTMMVAGLELFWKKKKGFPTVDEEIRYQKLLSNAKFNDRPRRVLSTSSGGNSGYPYLGGVNIPDTRYGS